MRKPKTTRGDDEQKKSSWLGGMSFKAFGPYQRMLLDAPTTSKLMEELERAAREDRENAYQESLKRLKAIEELEEFKRLSRSEEDIELLRRYKGRLPTWAEIKPDLLKLIASNSEVSLEFLHIRKLLPTHKNDKRYRVGVINCFTDNGSKLDFLSKALSIINSDKAFYAYTINNSKQRSFMYERTSDPY